MIRIIDKVGTGKTRKLLETAQAENAIVVCGNPFTMHQKAKAYGIIGIPNFINYYTFLNHKEENCCYVIDEVEKLLPYLTNNSIVGYSLTNEG